MAVDIADWQQHRLTVEDASTGVDYSLRSRFRMPLLVLLGVAGLVLMAACTNVTSLLLARAVRYQRDTVLRIAMGATPKRLIGEICAQHAAVVMAAVVAAVVGAIWFDRVLLAVFGASNGTFKLEIRPDLKLLAYASAIAVAAVAAFVLVPIWYAFRADASLLISTRSLSSRTSRLRHLICGAQIALVIPLIAICWVVGLRFIALVQPPSGSSRVVVAQLVPAAGRYGRDFPGDAYYRRLLEGAQSVPSVGIVALSQMRPFQRPLREPIDGSGTARLTAVNAVTNEYFSIMGITPLAGQLFEHEATTGAPPVAVLSTSAARAWFGSADAAIGRHIRIGHVRAPHLVVGVVRDAVVSSPDSDDRTAVYTHFWQLQPGQQQWPTLLARAQTTTPSMFEQLRVAVQSAGREYPTRMLTLADQWRASIARDELLAIVSLGFAAIGIILAVVGVYGLLSWVVGSRKQEIAVRMALGASSRQAANLIGWHAAGIIGAGAAFGVPLAWASTTAVPRVLGLTPVGSAWEPIGLSIAVTVLAGILAVVRPALRAWRTDPIESLKAM